MALNFLPPPHRLTQSTRSPPLQSRKAAGAARRAIIVAEALTFKGEAYVASADRSECFDCVTMINTLTGSTVTADWMATGGDLPFDEIAPSDALPATCWCSTYPGRAALIYMAIVTAGEGVNDPKAKVFGPACRAACETWLAPMFRQHLVAAYRVES